MIALLSPGVQVNRPARICPSDCLHLVAHDIPEERKGLVAFSRHQVLELLDFAAQSPEDQALLIHCFAGISRSTAAAYVIRAARNPEIDERMLARKLRVLAPSATPNPRIIALADDILDRNGRMIEAIKAIGRGAEASEGVPFEI